MDPLNGMTTFARVVEAGGFSRAADQLGLTKSSVSEAVRRLEDRLGVRLLERTTRRVTPTEAGQAFYARARRALDEALAADAEVRALNTEPVGRLRIAVPQMFFRLHVAPILPALIEANPGLRLEVLEGAGFVDLLEAGVDVAIRVTPAPADNLVVRRLGGQRVIIVGAPAYLAAHGTPAAPPDVAQHRTIGFSPLHWSREWRFEGPAGTLSVPVQPVVLADQGESLRAAALAGAGLTAIPNWMVADDLADGRLVEVLRAWRTAEQPIYAVYPSNRLMARKVRLFVDQLAQRLRRLPA
jgi:DNA-binding transcriptional LysR family regulator